MLAGAGIVIALFITDRDTSPASLERGKAIAEQLGATAIVHDITAALEAVGCYRRLDDAIRTAVPEWDPDNGDRCELTRPFVITVRRADGTERTARMSSRAYKQLVDAVALKRRLCEAMREHHAERHQRREIVTVCVCAPFEPPTPLSMFSSAPSRIAESWSPVSTTSCVWSSPSAPPPSDS